MNGGGFGGRRKRRVVVADDEFEMRTLLVLALRREGYEVLEVGDGWELMSLLLREAFANPNQAAADALLLDVTMPGCSGLQVLADLAGRRWRPNTAIITGNSDPAMHARARQLGASAVLLKPIELDALREVVAELVGDRREEPQGLRPAALLAQFG